MSELAKKIIAENIAKQERGEDASYLDLGRCGLTELPDLSELYWLHTLIVSNKWLDEHNKWVDSANNGAPNRLTSPPAHYLPASLNSLIFGGDAWHGSWQISDISFLQNLTALTSLDLHNNQISDISFLQNLAKLTSLNLHGNRISYISFLQNLTQLTSLDLSFNQIRGISSLQNLTSLNLSFNQISDISFLQNLSGLTSLDLSHNQISDISFLQNLTELTSLDLSHNQISDISFLQDLTQLTSLNLSFNQISDLRFLQNLTQLTSLDLRVNQISDLRFLQNLTQLTSLDLSFNQISDLRFLQNLTRLTELNLSTNQISDIHPLKPIIHQLRRLYVRGNPIQYIPKEIYEQGDCATDLRAYWQAIEDSQIALNQQLKVMFLGNGCVGKSTLLHWFLDGAFRDISLEEGRTHGIIIQQYPFPDSKVMAHFWDFGGQEVYHATHRLFLGRRTLYLLLWASETPERGEEQRHSPQYWLDMIADVADKNERSSVLVIQNRFEGQRERSLFDDEQRAAYEAQGLDVQTFSIDAKSGKGVKPLLAAIQEAAEELVESYQEQLPQSWVDIRSAVAKRRAAGEKTLPMADFLAICQAADKRANTQTILGYLHRAGELFHYDGRFGGQIILDQQWALKAVYAVLKQERIALYRGQFRVSDLIGFWRADHPQLSAEDAETFLQFMLDNRTAFYAKDKARGYDPELIVPQLLPEEAPPILHALEDISERLQHRVAYRFLHRDIIGRFIVRTAYLSEHREYWRQGIHIRQGQTKAAVFVENDAHGQPLLTLVCYGKGKEDLLQRIREELHKIRPLDKAQEYRLENGAWQPYSAALLEAREGKGGLAVRSTAPEAVDLRTFFQSLKIFISYSKYDRKDYLEPLLRYLYPLVRGGWLVPWEDSQILPGEEWDDRIKQEIERADIILLLVSTNSLNTDYIWNVEIEAAMRRHEAGTAWVVPVILSKCLWTEKDPNGEYIFPPAKLNALPAKGKPVSTWETREDAWDEVAESVKRICTKPKA